MGRPRTKTDTSVLEAAARVFSQKGPAEFTLGDVAKEAGLAPATLVQRFGSKRGLLLAIAKMAAEGANACFAMVRDRHRSPIKALFACFEMSASMAATPESLAKSLSFLQLDLIDPEFHHWMLVNAQATEAGYQALLRDAIYAGELARCDTETLTRLIQATLHGSMVSWAVFQKGTAAQWVRRDMEALLKPFRPAKRGNRRSKSG
jgi:AcrR family transcriptional regulator